MSSPTFRAASPTRACACSRCAAAPAPSLKGTPRSAAASASDSAPPAPSLKAALEARAKKVRR